mgnify:CR=1 FL=1
MDALELARRYTPPAAARVQRLRAYVDGTQYDGRTPFLSQGEDAPPMLERAPCIVDSIVRRAIESHVAMLASDGRWPLFGGVDTRASERAWKVRRAVRRSAADALGSGASVMVLDLAARDWLHLPHEWCTAMPGHLQCVYPSVVEEYDVEKRAWVLACYLVRVDVTSSAISWYAPARAKEDGTMPTFVVRETHAHGGVVRYERDGAVHAHLLDEIDALNFGLSQRHRAALYAGDPQIWERGVGEDVAQPRGRAHAQVEVAADGKGPHPKGTFRVVGGGRAGGGGAKKKGPGVLWSHPSTTYEAQMLTLPGDALTGIDMNARDIGERIARSLHFVELDLDGARVAAGMSGKALSILFERAINFVDVLRDDVGERLILPSVNAALVADGKAPIPDDTVITWGEYFADPPRSKAETHEISARAIVALSAAGIDTGPVVAALGLQSKPSVESAGEILAYHIEQGVVTIGEVRERLGLPREKPTDGEDLPVLRSEGPGERADVPKVRRSNMASDPAAEPTDGG